MKLPRYPALFLAGCGLAVLSHAQPAAPVSAEGPNVQLPDMKTAAPYGLKDFKLPAKGEVVEPGFPNGSAQLSVTYPGKAFSAGVPSGRATVGVLLDPEGRAVDFLVVRYTQPFFGEALLEEAKLRTYTPKHLRGKAVPGSFHFSYEFEAPTGAGNISGFDAVNRRMEAVAGGAKFIYEPHNETEIAGGQLEPLHVEVPVIPSAFPVPPGKTVRLLARFYVDETGQVRLPNIESSMPPELVAAAIAALQQWTFKPPVIKGRPVLVQTMRAVTFRKADGTSPQAAPPNR